MRQITLLALLTFMAIPLVMNAQSRPSAAGRGKAVFSPKTADALMDQHLQEIDLYGQAEFAAFKKALASKYSGSKREIDRIYPKDKVEPGDVFIEPGDTFKPGEDLGSLLARPGDVYYACALASVTGKPAATIFNSFARNQDWGAITRELGIKPGSKEFENLQSIVLGGIGKVPGKTVGATPPARPARRR
jgi:hypothetical protein